jgi:hypothetical protein
MYRQLYQMGGMGIGSLPTDFGQPLQVSQPMMNPSFGQMQPMMSNPMSNYGQTPLTMMGGGITRLGYQEGSMDPMMEPQMQEQMMQPSMQDQMMQEQMMQPPMQEQMMPQEASGAQPNQAQGETALLTIIQLLIEQGIDPETAKELAGQILEVFAQGGEPAVQDFANQLEQEEGMQQEEMQEPMMMAQGGLTSIDRARDMLQSRAPSGEFLAYINPQEAGILRLMGGAGQDVNVRGVPSYFKKFFKKATSIPRAIVKAVRKVASSPIGMIALSIAAPYAIGAFAPGFATLGGSGLMGAAMRAGISNLAIQGITTGKINPKQALMAAAGGALAQGVFGPAGGATTTPTSTLTNDLGYQAGGEFSLSSGVTPGVDAARLSNSFYVPPSAGPVTPPGFVERGITNLKNFGTNLVTNPLKTIGNVGTSALDFANKNKALTLAGATLALSALDQQPGESDDAYNLRAQTDPRVAQYITQYGGASKVYSPGSTGLYAMEGAVDPFAGRSSYAANGGRIGYADGTSLMKETLEKKGYGDVMKNMTPKEISELYDSVMGTFSRRFQAEGSMPMGEPRRNPAGIMELDYRSKGGFVPPIGVKEKADDIPAMLSNNEFVFTADAVRKAGGGSVDKGAQRMYGLMKQLEAGVA